MECPHLEEGTEVKSVQAKKPYVKPEILHELELETRAGSPLSPFLPFIPPGSRP